MGDTGVPDADSKLVLYQRWPVLSLVHTIYNAHLHTHIHMHKLTCTNVQLTMAYARVLDLCAYPLGSPPERASVLLARPSTTTH